jgi:small subunit ribosomal protein S21
MSLFVPCCPFFAFKSQKMTQILHGNHQQGGIKLEVKVIDNDVEKALKILKNKLSKSGLFKELKVRRAYEKPSVKKKRKTIEARRRLAKVQRRRSN